MRSLLGRLGLLFGTSLPVVAMGAGCSSGEGPAPASISDEVVSLPHTDVKNQAIGNCWIYATASWVEALHNAATQTPENLSESYWSYWHWFVQILYRGPRPKQDKRPDQSQSADRTAPAGGEPPTGTSASRDH
jgi:hypothetical protein